MDSEALAFTPATELASMIRGKRISPVEIIEATLARIAALEPRVNAFVHLASDAAMRAAREAEAALMRGDPVGRLHGVPATIKDLVITADMPTQFGSLSLHGNRPTEDAPIVTRLRRAGAIILGKTAVSEFGWKGVSQSPLSGITHNPWQHGMNAGASSAGAGAAAAAGFGPLHQGSDGAGSIRIPAHFCGVFGLKPSFGRVPNYPVASADFTSHLGPMTRTVADGALMLEVLAGPHPWDFTSLDSGPAPYLDRLGDGVAGRRIAFSPDLGVARVDPDVAALVQAAALRFAEFGAAVEEVALPWAADGPELIRALWPVHLARHQTRFADWEARMDPGFVACIREGAAAGIVDDQVMRARKMAYITEIHRWFRDWDFLLTPAASVAAFPADRLMPADWPPHDWDWLSWAEFSYPFNFSWNPTASVPCGFTAAGLPVGLQIVGRRGDDLGVLQAAAAFEAAAPWADKRPVIAG